MTAMSQKPQSDNTAGGVCRAVDDAELDALVMALTEQCAREHTYDSLHDEAAAAITTLRAQLAEARAELVRRVEMHECAMAERDDATLYGVEQKARADRAEAERAAQIEADAGICDALYRMALKDSDDDLSSPWKSHKASAYGTALQAIRAQPHDRTALDAAIRAAKVEAWKVAAKKATSFLVGDPANGVPLRSPMAHEIADAILALIEREATP